MTGIGIDLLDIARLERALERRPRLARRLFTDQELTYAQGQARPAQHLAARFCAKEATAKALALRAWSHHHIEVIGGGAPVVQLHGDVLSAANAAGVSNIAISLTHTDSTAGAVALAIGMGDGTSDG